VQQEIGYQEGGKATGIEVGAVGGPLAIEVQMSQPKDHRSRAMPITDSQIERILSTMDEIKKDVALLATKIAVLETRITNIENQLHQLREANEAESNRSMPQIIWATLLVSAGAVILLIVLLIKIGRGGL
jgi:hypothetical protein